MTILDDTLADHGAASWGPAAMCVCGEAEYDLEHLAVVVLEFTSGPQSPPARRREQNRARMREYDARRRREESAANLERTRALLRQLNAEQEQLAREADAIGFRTFADRADYLIDRDPWWHYRHGWRDHPFHADRRLTA